MNSVQTYLSKESFWYIVSDTINPWVKIGRTVNLESRFKVRGVTDYPFVLKYLFYGREDAVCNEAVLHNLFADQRLRGEWFSLQGKVHLALCILSACTRDLDWMRKEDTNNIISKHNLVTDSTWIYKIDNALKKELQDVPFFNDRLILREEAAHLLGCYPTALSRKSLEKPNNNYPKPFKEARYGVAVQWRLSDIQKFIQGKTEKS